MAARSLAVSNIFGTSCFSAMGLPPKHDMRGRASRRGDRRRRSQAQFLDTLFAHNKFLDLAGHGSGKNLDELDITWNFVMGDVVVTEPTYLLDAGVLALTQPHPSHDLLAVLRIGHADHLHIADLRVSVQKLLDLAWVYIFPTTNDHILDTADDVDVALVIHHRQIAAVHPMRYIDSIAGGLFV